MAWTQLTGAARADCVCASEGCGGSPRWELNVGGVGSIYCDDCRTQINNRAWAERQAHEFAMRQAE